MFEKIAQLQSLMDDVARKSTDKKTHELLEVVKEAIRELDRLEEEVGKAWADGDQVAQREFMGKAMQSLVMMAGIRVDKDGMLNPAIDGIDDGDVAIRSVAMLAERYGKAMMERDRLMRKGTST